MHVAPEPGPYGCSVGEGVAEHGERPSGGSQWGNSSRGVEASRETARLRGVCAVGGEGGARILGGLLAGRARSNRRRSAREGFLCQHINNTVLARQLQLTRRRSCVPLRAGPRLSALRPPSPARPLDPTAEGRGAESRAIFLFIKLKGDGADAICPHADTVKPLLHTRLDHFSCALFAPFSQ